MSFWTNLFGKPPKRQPTASQTSESSPKRNGQTLRLSHSGMVRALAFSPDGTLLATCSDGDGVCFWDAATGKQVKSSLKPKKGRAVSVNFSPDGRRVVVTATEFKSDGPEDVYVWDIDAGQAILTMPADVEASENWRFDTSGERLLAVGRIQTEDLDDYRVMIFDPANGECLYRTGPDWFAPDVMITGNINSDGKQVLAFVCGPKRGRSIVLANMETRQVAEIGLRQDLGDDIASELVIGDDGRYAAWSLDSACRTFVWDISQGRYACPPISNSSKAVQLQFSTGGRLAVGTANGEVQVYDVDTGRPVTSSLSHGGFTTALELSQDGKVLVASSQQGCMGRVWDVDTSRPLTPPIKPGGWAQTATISPDGTRAAVGGHDGRTLIVSISR